MVQKIKVKRTGTIDNPDSQHQDDENEQPTLGEILAGMMEQDMTGLCPVSAQFQAEEKAAAERAKQEAEDAIKSPVIGQMIEGKGVYAGTWAPKERDGNSLGKVFKIYAAPTDILGNGGQKILVSIPEMIGRLAAMKLGYNHAGFNHARRKNLFSKYLPDESLYEAIKNDDYHGECFIPPADILESLALHQHEGALAGTFAQGAAKYFNYWSCTMHQDSNNGFYNQNFPMGSSEFSPPESLFSMRLVRAEPWQPH